MNLRRTRRAPRRHSLEELILALDLSIAGLTSHLAFRESAEALHRSNRILQESAR